MAESTSHSDIMTLTTEIVSAHVANNTMAVADLPDLIQQVFRSLTNAGDGVGAEPPRPQPAVSIKQSVKPDYIVCLEDGRKLKMLKRRLRTAFIFRRTTRWWRRTTPSNARSWPSRSGSARARASASASKPIRCGVAWRRQRPFRLHQRPLHGQAAFPVDPRRRARAAIVRYRPPVGDAVTT